MEKSEFVLQKPATTGDIAVDGLFSGILAGLAMGLLMMGIGLLTGEYPAKIISSFSPSGGALSGLLTHLAVSSVYGVIYSLVFQVSARRWLPQVSILLSAISGLLYGLVLWSLAQFMITTQAGAYLADIPRLSLVFGHLAYGLSLGALIWRTTQGKPRSS